MPPESVRLFVAVDLPEAACEALAQLQRRLQALDSGHVMRWTAISSIHLTLKFLGETPISSVNNIDAALRQAVHGTVPFDLNVEDVGCFPDTHKPRVVWAGCSGDLKVLHGLRDAVERTISPLGFPTEDRPFSPHLTLGRARQDASKDAMALLGSGIAKLSVPIIASWPVHEVTLFRSDLKPAGAVYTPLAAARLAD